MMMNHPSLRGLKAHGNPVNDDVYVLGSSGQARGKLECSSLRHFHNALIVGPTHEDF